MLPYKSTKGNGFLQINLTKGSFSNISIKNFRRPVVVNLSGRGNYLNFCVYLEIDMSLFGEGRHQLSFMCVSKKTGFTKSTKYEDTSF